MLRGSTYFNFQTSANFRGEIRGQIGVELVQECLANDVLTLNGATFPVKISPNPVSERLTLTFDSNEQLYVYSFGTRERFLLFEKKIPSQNDPLIAINVPPNTLQTGSYRSTLSAHLSPNTEGVTRSDRWHGTTLIQVY